MRLTIDPQGLRLLVVDDEDYITDLVAVGLRFVGFEVETAADGREALAKVATTTPDLVVLDISMPELDGVEVLQRMRRDGIERAGDLPHRPRRARRSGPRAASRRRRLRDETVRSRGAAGPDRGGPPAHLVGAAASAAAHRRRSLARSRRAARSCAPIRSSRRRAPSSTCSSS